MEGDRGEFIPRITRRCLTDDLSLSADSVDLPIDDLASANDLIAAFRDRRAEMGSPGQEPIRCFSLTSSPYRCMSADGAQRPGTTAKPV